MRGLQHLRYEKIRAVVDRSVGWGLDRAIAIYDVIKPSYATHIRAFSFFYIFVRRYCAEGFEQVVELGGVGQVNFCCKGKDDTVIQLPSQFALFSV